VIHSGHLSPIALLRAVIDPVSSDETHLTTGLHTKMSAELRRLFPDGLKATDFERFKPRQAPTIPFVSKTPPTGDEQGDDISAKTITVELNNKTTTKVLPYVFQCVESFLAFQAEHDYILAQQGAKTNWEKLHKIYTDAETKMAAIPEVHCHQG
jgi:hypothetical protein